MSQIKINIYFFGGGILAGGNVTWDRVVLPIIWACPFQGLRSGDYGGSLNAL